MSSRKRKFQAAILAAKLRNNPIHRTDIPSVAAPSVITVEGADVTSPEFLKTFAWRRLRYKALRMTNGRCECCGASPQTGAVLNVDHIKPRKRRPELALDLFNLQVLCNDCNAGKGNWDDTDWR